MCSLACKFSDIQSSRLTSLQH
uniref:Uncharacterized protein n=1 Tax=Anguilla anguilla TaxID=7936 RepID=A0A0E9PEB7_ANGAN